MPFAAIDFELANGKPTSICALGVAVFTANRLVKRYKWLIRPPHGSGEFLAGSVRIHGITEDMVADAPEFYEIWETLAPILKGKTLIAHNAPFDAGVLRKNCDHFGIALDAHPYVCTCQIARKLFPELYNHKLSTVADYLGIPLNHHEPASDAVASGYIMLAAMKAVGARTPESAAAKLGVKVGMLEALDGEAYV